MFPGTIRSYSSAVHAAPPAAPMQAHLSAPLAAPTGGGDGSAQTQRAASAQKPPGEGVRRAAHSGPRAPRKDPTAGLAAQLEKAMREKTKAPKQ
jgi:hypothetical protein